MGLDKILPGVSFCYPGNSKPGLFWQHGDRYSRCRYLIGDEIFLNKKSGREMPPNFVESSDAPGCILRIADRFSHAAFSLCRGGSLWPEDRLLRVGEPFRLRYIRWRETLRTDVLR